MRPICFLLISLTIVSLTPNLSTDAVVNRGLLATTITSVETIVSQTTQTATQQTFRVSINQTKFGLLPWGNNPEACHYFSLQFEAKKGLQLSAHVSSNSAVDLYVLSSSEFSNWLHHLHPSCPVDESTVLGEGKAIVNYSLSVNIPTDGTFVFLFVDPSDSNHEMTLAFALLQITHSTLTKSNYYILTGSGTPALTNPSVTESEKRPVSPSQAFSAYLVSGLLLAGSVGVGFFLLTRRKSKNTKPRTYDEYLAKLEKLYFSGQISSKIYYKLKHEYAKEESKDSI